MNFTPMSYLVWLDFYADQIERELENDLSVDVSDYKQVKEATDALYERYSDCF